MAKKKKCPECPAGEKWAVPYADFLSLLLALFIALYAISAVNTDKAKALKTEFVKIFDYSPKPFAMQPVLPIPPDPGNITEITDGEKENKSTQDASSTVSKKNQEMSNDIIQQGGILEQIDGGIVLRLPTKLYFRQDSASINDSDTMLFLKRISEIIKKLPKNVSIDIRGFAEDNNIEKNKKFKNNYHLAATRAENVMNYIIESGIEPSRIFYSSYGQNKPLATNNTEENILKNNRVEIFFFVENGQIDTIQSILDKNIKR